MSLETNPQLELAFDYLRFTNKNVFLTGKAGTGKTTFLQKLKSDLPKRMVVVAPTGVAAINAGGVTMHSFFQLAFGPFIPGRQSTDAGRQDGFRKFSREKISIIRSLDLLVIDEVSMVRADLLDSVDEVLRRYRYSSQPFGGLQLLLIGDMQQLPPVLKDDERMLLQPYYQSFYFFGSRALEKAGFASIELKHIYRQRDEVFIGLLNKIRDNKLDADAINQLNQRHDPLFNPANHKGIITLTTHNAQAQGINDHYLQSVSGKHYFFRAQVKGEFPEYSYPADKELALKVGAQVMFLKNDASFAKCYFNGKIGTVHAIYEDEVTVLCDDSDSPITVSYSDWNTSKYTLNEGTKELEERVVGTFSQIPLKLAWAITIHKSQGLTFEKAVIDVQGAFAHGQIYVALSRCKSLEGLVLSTPFNASGVLSNADIQRFSDEVVNHPPSPEQLLLDKYAYQKQLLNELFEFKKLEYLFRSAQKVCSEHANVLNGDDVSKMKELEKIVYTDIGGVALRFVSQREQLLLENPDVEQNLALQERVKAAAGYFIGKLDNEMHQPISTSQFESDNKAVQKQYDDSFQKLIEEIEIKRDCIAGVQSGFTLADYLLVRAKALVGNASTQKKKKKSGANASFEGKSDGGLLDLLKVWRKSKVEELGMTDFLVLPQKTMKHLSQLLPQTKQALAQVHGLGKTKIDRYGDELIDLIMNYCEKNNIVPITQNINLPIAEKVEKKKKLDTKAETLRLFESGLTVEQIAAERGFVVTTIQTHLSHFVETGVFDVHQLISEEKVTAIVDGLKAYPGVNLGEAKSLLGDEFTYGEIRLALSHREFVTQ